MSATAAIRAYVPRNSSVPPTTSPNPLPKRQAYWPRTPSQHNSPAPVNEDVKRTAESILKLLGNLPAPLSASLPSTFIVTPRQSPSPSSSSASYPSFGEFARAQKRKASSSVETEEGEIVDERINVGLGLNIIGEAPSPLAPAAQLPSQPSSSGRPAMKRARTSDGESTRSISTSSAPQSYELARIASASGSHTPRSASLHLSSSHALSPHRQPRSRLRNEITKPNTADWNKDQWSALSRSLGARALLVKRYGDAYLSPPTAKGPLRLKFPEDQLQAYLLFTDSLCLYLYSKFCEERVVGHDKPSVYVELDPLRSYILKRWIDYGSKCPEEYRDLARGMTGFLYLVEAVIQQHLSVTELRILQRKGREVASTPQASNGAAASTASAGSAQGPSPSSSSASPGTVTRSPAASSAHSELPADMLKLLNSSASASSNASRALLSSRQHLSIRTLRETYPQTWDCAINSDIIDDLLPSPVDSLGCARYLDIDDPDTFAWPIELGMPNGVAHVAVYGRALVREFSQSAGKQWEPVIADESSPP